MASRQFGRLRLSPVIKWAQLAPHIKKLRLRYDPAHAGARGLKYVYFFLFQHSKATNATTLTIGLARTLPALREFKRQAHGPKV